MCRVLLIYVFKNRVLRIFGPKTDEIIGSWRKLHNEELHNLYSSPNIIRMIMSRRMRWAGHIACIGKKRNANRVLVGKPEGKRPLGRPRCRWEDNIKMGLRQEWYGQDSSCSGEGPVEGSCEQGNEPSTSTKCWEVLEWMNEWQLLKKDSAPWS
jgi:hypothetical protein